MIAITPTNPSVPHGCNGSWTVSDDEGFFITFQILLHERQPDALSGSYCQVKYITLCQKYMIYISSNVVMWIGFVLPGSGMFFSAQDRSGICKKMTSNYLLVSLPGFGNFMK